MSCNWAALPSLDRVARARSWVSRPIDAHGFQAEMTTLEARLH